MNFRNWIANHPDVVRVFLLSLAALDVQISYALFPDYPHLPLVNAALAAILVLGVYLSW
jgi:hypothetical protein